MKVAVLGSGSWGTALAVLAADNGHETVLWGRDPTLLEEMSRRNENPRHLAGVTLPSTLGFVPDLHIACRRADALVIAVPSRAFRSILRRIGSFRGPAISVTKGIEYDTGLTMAGIMEEVLPEALPATLSGPTIAREIAEGMPAAAVAAGRHAEAALAGRKLFHRPAFRIYTSPDMLGVELGGALKNVIAIAAGVVDGLGFGDNSKAALITRGVAEIRRLGVAAGASPDTFAGLSGLGDLTVTCFSPLSRNRTFGEELGRGRQLGEILKESRSTVEGIPTARSARRMAERLGIETPIIDEVHDMVHCAKPVRQALQSLLTRTMKPED